LKRGGDHSIDTSIIKSYGQRGKNQTTEPPPPVSESFSPLEGKEPLNKTHLVFRGSMRLSFAPLLVYFLPGRATSPVKPKRNGPLHVAVGQMWVQDGGGVAGGRNNRASPKKPIGSARETSGHDQDHERSVREDRRAKTTKRRKKGWSCVSLDMALLHHMEKNKTFRYRIRTGIISWIFLLYNGRSKSREAGGAGRKKDGVGTGRGN